MALPETSKVIVDTNVLFSGLARRGGNPALVLEAVMPGRMLISAELLAEYRRVLGDPRGLAYLGISVDALDVLLKDIVLGGTIDPGGIGPDCPDPDDQHLWDLLASGPDSILVTGEHKLLRSHHYPGRILSPRDFVARFLEA